MVLPSHRLFLIFYSNAVRDWANHNRQLKSNQCITKRIGLAILVSLTAVVYALWIWYLCWKVDLVDRYWGWVWLSVCFDMVGSAISGGAQLWYITFVFSVIDCIAVTIILSLTRKTWATFGLVIVLCLALIICGF